jgi:hypothetical protein
VAVEDHEQHALPAEEGADAHVELDVAARIRRGSMRQIGASSTNGRSAERRAAEPAETAWRTRRSGRRASRADEHVGILRFARSQSAAVQVIPQAHRREIVMAAQKQSSRQATPGTNDRRSRLRSGLDRRGDDAEATAHLLAETVRAAMMTTR